MGCRSDYLEQTGKERGLQQAAHLLDYVVGELRERTNKPYLLECSTALRPEGFAYYAKDVGQVEALCQVITAMSDEHREAIVYNAHSKISRELATWWEAHQAADRAREEKEQAAIRNAALREQALAKLTPEEQKALGVS